MGRAKEIFDRVLAGEETAIDNFILTRQQEELFLDFKRSNNNGSTENLDNTDRSNLSKAISGFANSEGGVIVWGIDCSKDYDGADVAKEKILITKVSRFCSLLEGAISGATIPPHNGVINRPIAVEGDRGYVITLIPKSIHAPHQVIDRKNYYMRAGSNHVPIPHGILSWMFGRQPQPIVFIAFGEENLGVENSVVKFSLNFIIHNSGPGIAKDLYIVIKIPEIDDENCNMKWRSDMNWKRMGEFDNWISLISNSDIRLPPHSVMIPITLDIELRGSFGKSLKIEGQSGSGNSEPYKFSLESSPDSLNKFYDEVLRGIRKDVEGIFNKQESTEFLMG